MKVKILSELYKYKLSDCIHKRGFPKIDHSDNIVRIVLE